MKKQNIGIWILVIIVVVIALIVVDFTGGKPGKRAANPYEFNVDEFRHVDESLIHYKETRNIQMGNRVAGGIDVLDDRIYLTGENFLMVISTAGKQLLMLSLEGKGECIKATPDRILVGFETAVSVFDREGKIISTWKIPDERTVITSIAVKENRVYIADAGNRRVLRYDFEGNLLGEFEGKRESMAGHGFIVPSPNFDLVVNSYGELWVVNPGEHSIENYTDEGEIRGYWTKSSMQIEGFTGCCNPAEISSMDDGSFITSEKGMVRIKIYDPSGKLVSVVAPPDKFVDEGHAPEVVADHAGVIYALDFDRNIIRIFEKKTV